MEKYAVSDLIDLTGPQLAVIRAVESDEELTDFFYLTGGTLLKARGIVPRESNDLDFFTLADKSERQYMASLRDVKALLQQVFGEANVQVTDKGFLHQPSGMVVDVVADAVPNIAEFVSYGRLLTASISDIAAHKASAVCSRDEIKDYIDIAFLTNKQQWLLKDLEVLAEKKFGLGTISEEKLLTELLAKKESLKITTNMFLRDGENNVNLVQKQIDKLVRFSTL